MRNDWFKSYISQWLDRYQVQARFVLVGIWNTIFGYSVFIGLDSLLERFIEPRYIAYMSAGVLSNIIAITNAFIFHKYITFQSKAKGKDLPGEFLRFCATYIFSIILGLILLPLFVEIFFLTPRVAGAFIVLICTGISYLGHSRFSFKSYWK